MISSASDIRSAIRVYYGVTPGGEVAIPPPPRAPMALAPEPSGAALAPTEAPPAAPPIELPKEGPLEEPPPSSETPVSVQSVETEDSPHAWPEVEAHTLDLPKRKGPKMVALTLLDGTTIRLPAKPNANDKQPATVAAPGAMTARDLIQALRAVSQGADATEILGEKVPLEAICAALLSLLLKKGLLADWEFVDELRKT
jgi:type IV pilus assembly protein PilB